MNKTIDLLMSHTSIRKYQKKDIDEQTLRTIIEAAQWSATSSHFQAYTIINVKDNHKRQIISEIAGGQKWVMESPVFLMFCADLKRGKTFWKNTNPEVFGNTEMFIVATVDAALTAQKTLIAAQSFGIGGVYIGGIRNELHKLSELLELPELVYPVFGMCLGYPDENPGKKPRLPLEVIYKVDKYNDAADTEQIVAYDKIVQKYYKERSITDTWCERSGRNMMAKTRDDIGEFLKGKGFCRK